MWSGAVGEADHEERDVREDVLRAQVTRLKDALRHCELLAFTGLQTAVTRGDDDGQRRAAFFREIRETVRGALNGEEMRRG